MGFSLQDSLDFASVNAVLHDYLKGKNIEFVYQPEYKVDKALKFKSLKYELISSVKKNKITLFERKRNESLYTIADHFIYYLKLNFKVFINVKKNPTLRKQNNNYNKINIYSLDKQDEELIASINIFVKEINNEVPINK